MPVLAGWNTKLQPVLVLIPVHCLLHAPPAVQPERPSSMSAKGLRQTPGWQMAIWLMDYPPQTRDSNLQRNRPKESGRVNRFEHGQQLERETVGNSKRAVWFGGEEEAKGKIKA